MFSNPDFVLYLELAIIAVVVIVQLTVFFNNSAAISGLKKALPEAYRLDMEFSVPSKVSGDAEQDNVVEEANKLALIKKPQKCSDAFSEIVDASNRYLVKNRGAAEFPPLKLIAESRTRSMENAIDNVIAQPLYLGLLGTFTGVIIGLVKIAFMGMVDEAIESFIGGVLIGMIASAFGLLLVVISNSQFKSAMKAKDQHLFDYFDFLRQNLLPRNLSTLPPDLRKLRYQLAAFSEAFTDHQQQVNQSLGESLHKFGDLNEVLERFRSLESDVASIGYFLKNSRDTMEQQIGALEQVNKKTLTLTNQIGLHMEKVSERLQERRELGSAAPLDPALTILEQPEQLGLAQSLIQKISDTETANRQLVHQLTALHAFLQQALQDRPQGERAFFNSGTFKTFTLLGTIAFVLGIGLGIWHMVQLLSASL